MEENVDEEGIGQKGENVEGAIQNHRKRASGIDFLPHFMENSHMSSGWDLGQFTGFHPPCRLIVTIL